MRTVRRSHARVFDPIERVFVQEDPDVPNDFAPNPDSNVVEVLDRAGTGLPFSKGLMATSVLATGLRTEQAYAIAAEIQHRLIARRSQVIDADELADLAITTIEDLAGVVAAKRYRSWRRAKRTGRPVIVALAGAPGVGKSTIATRLAVRLSITRVVTTDTIREVLRSVIPRSVLPELHISTYETTETHPGDPPLGAFHRQSRAVSAATVPVAARLASEYTSAIIEGVHLMPGYLRQALADHPARPIVVEMTAILGSIETHRAHLVRRTHREPTRDGQRHLRHLERIRDLQGLLIEQAKAADVPVYDIAHSHDLTQRIVDEVVARIEEPVPMTSSAQ